MRHATAAEDRMNVKDNWRLAKEICFLNHGSFGACPAAVLDAQQALRERIEREPVTFFMRDYHGLLDETRQALAAWLGADAAGLVFVPNATTAVNAVVNSLALKPGDALLVTNHGYAACTNALTFAAQRAGARVVAARVPFPVRDEDDIVAAVLAAAPARARLALIDHVTSPTALVFPAARIVRALEDRGIPVMIDGAHAPGMLPLELDALGASYYTGNCHKWMCNPKGAAFLYARADTRDGLYPTVISHGLTSPIRDRSRFHHLFDWPGTYDPTAVLTLPATLRIMPAFCEGGWDGIRRANGAKALRGRDCIARGLGLAPCAPDALLGAMASFLLPRDFGGFPAGDGLIPPLQEHLFRAYGIEVPVMPWDERGHILRISAHLYNEDEDYARLRDALAEIGRGAVS